MSYSPRRSDRLRVFPMMRAEYKIGKCAICGSRSDIAFINCESIERTTQSSLMLFCICPSCQKWAVLDDILYRGIG